MGVMETNSIESKTGTSASEPSHYLIAQVGRYEPRARASSDLIRYYYNTMAHDTSAVHGNGALSWKMPTGFRKSWLKASL
jgi:hypothetical protein